MMSAMMHEDTNMPLSPCLCTYTPYCHATRGCMHCVTVLALASLCSYVFFFLFLLTPSFSVHSPHSCGTMCHNDHDCNTTCGVTTATMTTCGTMTTTATTTSYAITIVTMTPHTAWPLRPCSPMTVPTTPHMVQ